VGFLLNQNGFVLERKERTSRINGRESESERRGRKRRETSRTVSTKRLPPCVCSILSMSKTSRSTHSLCCCLFLSSTTLPDHIEDLVTVGVLNISASVGVSTIRPP
jgi:hypothetical protein